MRPTSATPTHTLGWFQSTHPHGVRLAILLRHIRQMPVSIHAPARGATWDMRQRCRDYVFQSTHPHGVRRHGGGHPSGGKEFQSTHPHGVRLEDAANEDAPHGVSIHAPARGATVYRSRPPISLRVSIHAPARGATDDVRVFKGVNQVSIHAPARGATKSVCVIIFLLYKFQSTHPHGVRPLWFSRFFDVSLRFNPRTRTGCD